MKCNLNSAQGNALTNSATEESWSPEQDRPWVPSHPIVGIGASAGGLEALEKLFSSLPSNLGMSYVVIQHLSPDFKSHMDDLLRRVTEMPVEMVSNGMVVEPNRVYLIPPKSEMVISNYRLLLTDRPPERTLSHPIDQFLRSLSQDVGSKAIAIVLSGTGSDGSKGVVEIAHGGGLVIAQEPQSAKFDSMPVNAQQTGQVHLTLSPDAIGEALRRYSQQGHSAVGLRDLELVSVEETGMRRIFQLLQASHHIDFSNYKSTTVDRRVQRRIDLQGVASLDEYVDRLNQDPVEVNELYKDLMIGVTQFFRDPEAFEYIEHSVLPNLIDQASEQGLRLWVCGCATGEEAYSLAMLVIEALEKKGRPIEFKIFATDAHKESLQFAATGVYSEAKLNTVSMARRERFFKLRPEGYYVTSELRRRVVFAPHNVLHDPPFTQMNLVSCRNMLIYLDNHAQRKTLSLFHFALKTNGVLFLGPSESTGDIRDEFESIEKHWRVFRKIRDVRLPIDLRIPHFNRREPLRADTPPAPENNSFASPVYISPAVRRAANDQLTAAYDLLLSELMPPSVLVDSQFEVLHAFAGCEPYLNFPSGRPTTNLLNIVYQPLRTSLSAAMQHAIKDGEPVRYSGMPHPIDPERQVRLLVRPLKIPHQSQPCLLIQFESIFTGEAERPREYQDVDLSVATASRIESLERELNYSRQNLQATIEALETSNEELQATNEEMVAANEELQSTNEELHSVNEELYTVNAEHQKRVLELDEANADMNNLLATTRVGVIFLDRELRIRRFTPEVARMLSLEVHDIGRSVSGFIAKLDDDQFLPRLNVALEQRREQEWESSHDGQDYLVRALPYWTGASIAGVVVSFVSLSSLKLIQAELYQFKFMADENIDAQILLNAEGKVVYANKMMSKRLGYAASELLGMRYMDIDEAHDHTNFPALLAEAEARGGLFFESMHVRKNQERFPVEVAVTHVRFKDEPYLFATIRDITERKQSEVSRKLLEKAIATVRKGIVITDATKLDQPIIQVNNGFMQMTGYTEEEAIGRNCRFLQGPESSPEAIEQMRLAISRGESQRVLIRNYRKDRTPFWNEVYLTPVVAADGTVTNYVGALNDVTDLIEYNQRAEERERTIRLLLDSTAEGIYGVDHNGICTFCNAACVRLLGYDSPDQLVGKNVHDLIHHHQSNGDLYPAHDCGVFQSLWSGLPTNNDTDVFWKSDGTCFPVEYWSHPVKVDDRVTGVVVTFFDTTLRRQQQEALRQAQENAEAASEAKSRFLANMSHELRTPLAAILGFTKIIQEEYKDHELLEKVSTIQRNGDYLLRLLNDVLDLSRIEAGKFSVTPAAIRLDELLTDIQETMDMRRSEYDTLLEFKLDDQLPQVITTDFSRLRQVLVNLIGNAIKFAAGGKVLTTVHCWRGDEPYAIQGQATLSIVVDDDGIGISEEQLAILFKPFSQADSTIVHRFGGTGLGLSISKRLVEALGGTIHVESKLGEGSRFEVRIPVEPASDWGQINLSKRDAPTSGHASWQAPIASQPPLNAKVLIADDMRDVRFVAQHFLRKAGCEIQVAENGLQAVELIQEAARTGNPFDLVLMDVQMPVMGGVEAVGKLRQLDFDIPVVALTADAMKGTRRKLLAAGFDDYLTKPLDISVLMSVASNLLARERS